MSAHIVDRSLPYSSQSTCVRLSLNLVECLYQSFKRSDSDMNGKIQAQQLLSKILESFVSKLRSLQVGQGSTRKRGEVGWSNPCSLWPAHMLCHSLCSVKVERCKTLEHWLSSSSDMFLPCSSLQALMLLLPTCRFSVQLVLVCSTYRTGHDECLQLFTT
jgi:hypothetical protein